MTQSVPPCQDPPQKLLFARRPFQDDGLGGFAVGICQGLAGVATKPMVGCLDAVTHTGEAVREMAGGLASGDGTQTVWRARFPQPFGPDGRMMPRTIETACGAVLLEQFPFRKVVTTVKNIPSSPVEECIILLQNGRPAETVCVCE